MGDAGTVPRSRNQPIPSIETTTSDVKRFGASVDKTYTYVHGRLANCVIDPTGNRFVPGGKTSTGFGR